MIPTTMADWPWRDQLGTDPNYPDTDHDTFWPKWSPLNWEFRFDSDNDGILMHSEIKTTWDFRRHNPGSNDLQHLDVADALDDYDPDGINNLDQFLAGLISWSRYW